MTFLSCSVALCLRLVVLMIKLVGADGGGTRMRKIVLTENVKVPRGHFLEVRPRIR